MACGAGQQQLRWARNQRTRAADRAPPTHLVPSHPPHRPRSRFLQGPGTDRAAVAELKAAFTAGKECTVKLLNYTKQGRPFWNLLTVRAGQAYCGRGSTLLPGSVSISEPAPELVWVP